MYLWFDLSDVKYWGFNGLCFAFLLVLTNIIFPSISNEEILA